VLRAFAYLRVIVVRRLFDPFGLRNFAGVWQHLVTSPGPAV
jgi:hypothetical protein